MAFDIIICGGGIGGLSAAICLRLKGHPVTVLESSAHFDEIGAGIQVPPNSSRILQAMGLGREVEILGDLARTYQVRRYSTNELISKTPLSGTRQFYDHP
jgi:salicylate hydroxylase